MQTYLELILIPNYEFEDEDIRHCFQGLMTKFTKLTPVTWTAANEDLLVQKSLLIRTHISDFDKQTHFQTSIPDLIFGLAEYVA